MIQFCKTRRRPAMWLAIAVAIAAASASSHRAHAAPAVSQSAAPTRFSVTVTGQGPNVILIPGLSTPREVWQPSAEALKGQYRVHLVQLRGFGEAAGPNGEGPVLSPFVDELAQYISANHLKRPAVIGHSMGGLSALMLASRHPAVPGRVMVVDAVPFIGTLFDPNATVETLRPQAERMKATVIARAEANKGAPLHDCSAATGEAPSMPGVMSVTAQGVCRIGNWMQISDAQVTANAMFDDMTTDMRPDLGKITVPLTVLYAADTRAMPLENFGRIYAQAYAGATGVKLVPVPGAAHFVMLDQPDTTMAAISGFLKGQ